jgi:phosphatidylglycerophosphatase A
MDRSGRKDTAAEWLATWFGCGRSPLAPGTVGTLGALPLYWLIRRMPWPGYLGLLCLLTGLGTWASDRVARADGAEDPQRVVIDEVAGTLLALLMVRDRSRRAKIASVILFRLLDITKPGPIGLAERLRPPGVGIMADDLAAGLAAGLIARAFGR